MADNHFWRTKFEILLLAFFVLIFVGLCVWASIFGHESVIAFAIDNNKTFAGALLMALTGRALSLRKDDNGNGNGKSQTVTPAPPDRA